MVVLIRKGKPSANLAIATACGSSTSSSCLAANCAERNASSDARDNSKGASAVRLISPSQAILGDSLPIRSPPCDSGSQALSFSAWTLSPRHINNPPPFSTKFLNHFRSSFEKSGTLQQITASHVRNASSFQPPGVTTRVENKSPGSPRRRENGVSASRMKSDSLCIASCLRSPSMMRILAGSRARMTFVKA